MQASEKPRALVPAPHFTTITLSDPDGGAAYRIFEFKIQPETKNIAEVTVSCDGYTYTTQLSTFNPTVSLPISDNRIKPMGRMILSQTILDDDALTIIEFSGTLKTNTWMATGTGPNLSNTVYNRIILGIYNAKTLAFITF